jgi:(heptosyl)LPS beta-1,4-glucosyltransferase
VTAVSAIVLTLNEEALIGRCLDSLAFLDEVVVVDSGSADRTREIAAGRGAKVVGQEWLGWVPQRQAGIAAARNDWVMVVEADEVVTPRLRAAIERVAAGPMDPRDAYSVDRRGEFLGVLLPNEARRRNIVTFARLFHREHSHYDPGALVHERVVYPGEVHLLDGVLLHWRGVDLHGQIEALNRYATVEADVLDGAGVAPKPWKLVVMPLLRFVWLYVVKREYRLGVPGLMHAQVRAIADFTRHAKHWERHHADRDAPPPADV